MPEIRFSSHRARAQRGWRFAARVSDLEAALSAVGGPLVFLNVHFQQRQAYWKEDRERIQREGRYQVVVLHHDRERSRTPFSGPWDEHPDAPVVSATVAPIPRQAGPAGMPMRPIVRRELSQAVGGLALNHPPWHRWTISLLLDSTEGELEVVVARWTGLRQEVPETHRVALHP